MKRIFVELVRSIQVGLMLVTFTAMAEIPIALDSPDPTLENPLLAANMLIELAGEHFINTREPDTLSLATLELSGHADLTPRLMTDILFSYDEDSESIEFDTFTLNYQHEQQDQWLLATGRDYLPFGAFITHQVNDTLALEFAETRQLFAGIAYENYGVVTELYVYQNEGEDNARKLGGSIAYQGHLHHLGLDYIESLHGEESISIHGHMEVEKFILIAEQVVSLTSRNYVNQVELACRLGEFFISAAYQVSHVLEALELPAEKVSLTVHGDLNQYAQLGIELGRADGNESVKTQLSILL